MQPLSPDLARLITEQARSLGYQQPEEYLRVVFGTSLSDSPDYQLTDEEFTHVLDEIRSEENLPSLPANFSRADIYADHD